ncbi:TetR/AcrR family transcriptional regulator [Thermophilibacter provencensis]|uniref:TetR/AcrR family transcriptional regulator n=1 Tax=Thermophilibacter provencensis TaxID=1852386 RepID=A0ABT7V4J7_9ACTN|nr:TetR/AcrR family transcriptional regulator [Thermophilibacter provencensis]MDM8271522.1 TetR/AcrR family transcriptional regulator [Thermophilibacter provencensis]
MPKLIPNLRKRILEQADLLLRTEGYRALSMRELARRCNVSPGTIYNHFADKDEIIATITLADWRHVIEDMERAAQEATSLAPGLTELCCVLDGFTARYRHVWEQYDGVPVTGYVARFHRELRSQIAAPIGTVVSSCGREDLAEAAGVIAEALLACSVDPELGAQQFGKLASALDASNPTRRNS